MNKYILIEVLQIAAYKVLLNITRFFTLNTRLYFHLLTETVIITDAVPAVTNNIKDGCSPIRRYSAALTQYQIFTTRLPRQNKFTITILLRYLQKYIFLNACNQISFSIFQAFKIPCVGRQRERVCNYNVKKILRRNNISYSLS